MKYKTLLIVSLTLGSFGCVSKSSGTGNVTPNDPLRVRNLVIVDDSGAERVWIGTRMIKDRSVTGIFMLDPDGTRRLVLGTTQDGAAGLVQWDETGTLRSFVGTSARVPDVGISVMDELGNPVVHIGTAADGSGQVEVLGIAADARQTVAPNEIE